MAQFCNGLAVISWAAAQVAGICCLEVWQRPPRPFKLIRWLQREATGLEDRILYRTFSNSLSHFVSELLALCSQSFPAVSSQTEQDSGTCVFPKQRPGVRDTASLPNRPLCMIAKVPPWSSSKFGLAVMSMCDWLEWPERFRIIQYASTTCSICKFEDLPFLCLDCFLLKGLASLHHFLVSSSQRRCINSSIGNCLVITVWPPFQDKDASEISLGG